MANIRAFTQCYANLIRDHKGPSAPLCEGVVPCYGCEGLGLLVPVDDDDDGEGEGEHLEVQFTNLHQYIHLEQTHVFSKSDELKRLSMNLQVILLLNI